MYTCVVSKAHKAENVSNFVTEKKISKKDLKIKK